MTPAERVILATLADVYEDWPARAATVGGRGPYRVAGDRLGLPASRVAEVEEAYEPWPGIFVDYAAHGRNIRRHLP